MDDFDFRALGTEWRVTVDEKPLSEEERAAILAYVADFERRFSRFRMDSEVNAFRGAAAGRYDISREFSVLLGEAARLKGLTRGRYDPAVGGLLELAGYDAAYRMEPSAAVREFAPAGWSLDGAALSLDGPAAFDLGGTAKGYCIDRVADLLSASGRRHFAVDGGGDLYVTTKRDGSPWKVAVQYPGKPDTAASLLHISDGALAVSDSFHRRWGKWHHIVDPHRREPVRSVIGAAAAAPSAWYADCMTSALFLADPRDYRPIASGYGASYIAFNEDGTSLVSADWAGEVF